MNQELSAYKKVRQYIVDEIKKSRLLPNSKLPTEETLSDILHLSKNSVRESLKILASRGVIETIQGSGHYVKLNIEDDLIETLSLALSLKTFTSKDLSDVREAIDLKAFELACDNMVDQEIIDNLNKCIENMKNGINMQLYDIEFHKKLVEASGNPLIISIHNALIGLSENYILISWDDIDFAEKNSLIEIHENILDYLINKNASSGKLSLVSHYKIANKLFSNHKDLLLKQLKKIELSEDQIKKIYNILME